MVRIELLRQDRGGKRIFKGFTMRGHADAGPHGQDLVCCAASTLAIGTVNAIQELLKYKDASSLEVQPGRMDFIVGAPAEDDRVQFALGAFAYNMGQLQDQYPQYIQIETKERTES